MTIVYKASKEAFLSDYSEGIGTVLAQHMSDAHIGYAKREQLSWENSLEAMYYVLDDDSIPGDSTVALEYMVPYAGRGRIDFLITGYDAQGSAHLVIVELKQWKSDSAYLIPNTDLVSGVAPSYDRQGLLHPSEQALSYSRSLQMYNNAVETLPIACSPCAYLHNYLRSDEDPLFSDCFIEVIQQAPPFVKSEYKKLRNFLAERIVTGDKEKILLEVDGSQIRPAKMLQDALASMLENNEEFILDEDQRVTFKRCVALYDRYLQTGQKQIMIIKGGPGTGKSVLAIQLLGEFIKNKHMAAYVTKNSTPRKVYSEKLAGIRRKKDIQVLFTGADSFYDMEPDVYQLLLVDEAHRLAKKSGMFAKGAGQIHELIKSSNVSIFFLDENQIVTGADFGSYANILAEIKYFNAEKHDAELISQFRCDESDGYVDWVKDSLGIAKMPSDYVWNYEYDVQVVNSPEAMHSMIRDANKHGSARVLSGYCWDWSKESAQNSSIKDISIGDYHKSWNIDLANQAWATNPNSIEEVGCIYTCQGIEFDYVGVIIGRDLVYKNGEVSTNYESHAKTDKKVFSGLLGKLKVKI